VSIIPTTQRPSESPSTQIKGDLASLKGARSNQELLTKLDEYYSNCRKYRLQFEQQWFLNLAFYFGRHYLQWTNSKAGPITVNRLIEPQAPPWRVRLVVNRVRQIVRKEMAKLTKERPIGFVIPKSADQEDQMAAKAGDALVEYFWREKKYYRELRRAVFWSVLTGTGFIKDWYNPQAITSDNQKGDLFFERINPFLIYVSDVQEEEIENQAYIIHQSAEHPDQVAKKYGQKVIADSRSNATVLEDKYLNVMGIRESNNKNLVLVKEIWIKPCPDYPEGNVIVWAGSNILHETKGWPYIHKEYPFSKLEHIPAGRFYSESIVTDLIPLQKEYNRSRSQLIETKNRMSKPQILAPKGSIDPNRITSEPGLIITYQPGFEKPQVVTPPNVPSYVIEDQNRTLTDMSDVASQHEISQGQTPPGVSAATAISYLQEQDDTVLSYSISSIEEATEKVSRHCLSHVVQFWDAERQIQVVGLNGQFEVYELNKDGLRQNTNFTIQIGSSTPKSLAAKQAFIMELIKMGIVPPDKGLRYLEMSEISRLYEELQIDTRHAQRENLLFQQGVDAPVNTWDNHLMHINEHDNFRKGQIYETLDPQIQAMLEQHVQNHKRFILVQKGFPPQVAMAQQLDPLMMEHLLYTPAPSMLPVGQGEQQQQQHSAPSHGGAPPQQTSQGN
jgi:hypothetical protein